jgi:hypothetical protein
MVSRELYLKKIKLFIFTNKSFNCVLFCFIFMFSVLANYGQATDSVIKKSSFDNLEHSTENLMSIKQGWFIGVDGGVTLFYGDVSLYNKFPKTKDFSKSAGNIINIFGGKKFKFGLSAEANVFKGTLKGEKQADRLYRRYFNADIMGYSVSAKYNLSQLLFRDKNDRVFFNRLSVYLTVGGGQIFFRSRLYKLANNNLWYLENVSGFSATGIDSAGISTAGGLVADKAKTISAIIVPVGGKLNFKLNQKTNLVLDISYVTCFTDKLDSWTRNWTHKDRYLSAGLGLVHNFGMKTNSDIPDSDRFMRPKAKKSKASVSVDAYEKSPIGNSSSTKKGGLFKKKAKKEDKDLEIKLKLYELQLKLFEMQYLVE